MAYLFIYNLFILHALISNPVEKQSTFQKFSHFNALESKFDLDVK